MAIDRENELESQVRRLHRKGFWAQVALGAVVCAILALTSGAWA